MTIKQALQNFWRQYPALLYGISSCLGAALFFNFHVIFFLPILFLFVSLLEKKQLIRLFLGLLMLLLGYFSGYSRYILPENPRFPLSGKALVEIERVGLKTNHMGKAWTCKGVIKTFKSKCGQTFKNIPCTLNLPAWQGSNPPAADARYLIKGTLKKTTLGNYRLIPEKSTPWMKAGFCFSLAEKRLIAKNWVKDFIFRHIPSKKAAVFLAGLASGEFDDPEISFEFSRFSLQHILAISGFHFSIIANVLSLFFLLLISRKRAHGCLIFLLSSYFLFLGAGASVLRAWIMITLAFLASLFEKKPKSLNLLGIALLIICFFDPWMVQTAGFQFSFFATGAILLLYPLLDAKLEKYFKKRPLFEVVEMDLLNQHGYLALTWIRRAIALGSSVYLATTPLVLYYFKSFPLIGFFYNLFFPALVSVSMLLLLAGLLLGPFGRLIHLINSCYSDFILNLVYNFPTAFDLNIELSSISFSAVAAYLSFLFAFGIALQNKKQDRRC